MLVSKGLLTDEEVRRLTRLAQGGDIDARNELVSRNLGLVGLAASRLSRRGIPKEDLMQEGVLGLIEAISRFDPDVAKFSTYAQWWIRNFMFQALKRQSLVSIPVYLQTKRNKAKLPRFPDRIGEPEASRILERPVDADARVDDEDELRHVERTMARVLTDRERLVVRGKFGFGEERTYKSMGRDLSITRERVRQIHDEAIGKIREAVHAS